MFQFYLNGVTVECEKNKKLIDYLRDDLGLTSVKNGCGEGACGACMILVNGISMRACILNIEKVQGKKVTTIEGLPEREKSVFAWAFTEAGAVQCGFCIPGMVISAVGLFNKTLNPTNDEIKKAIRGNVCRCTGYVKIEKAIKMAAKALRENIKVPIKSCKGLVGERVGRIDAKDKILGTGKYAGDLKVEGMLYGVALRSKYPRALVKSIDISKAEKLAGVEKIVLAKDIPGDRYIGHLKQDWPALIAVGEETRYVGDAIALVAGKTEEIARMAINLIEVQWEDRIPVTSPKMALKKDAAQIHQGGNILVREVLKRGNVDKRFKESKYIVHNTFSVPFTEHAFLEPESALAIPKDEYLEIHTGSQSVYDEHREITKLLGLESEKLRVIGEYVGGGFGGKEDMSCQHHVALLAYLTNKPVKMTLTRKESIMVHPKRHAMELDITTACDEEGKLTAMKARIISDTGAYASLGGPVLQRACTHAAGPYNYQDIDIEGIAVYTNNPPGGAFRGFGVTQSIFANECNMNLLAEKVGISPWEIRWRNAIEPGNILPNGQIADEGTALKETLLAVKDQYENEEFAGIACAIKNAGVGVGIPDTGRCNLKIIDGKVHTRISAACIGQGLATIITQIICQTTNISMNKIVHEQPDTKLTPNSGTTTASRQTVFTGEASKNAALKLKNALENNSIEELEGKEFYGEYTSKTDKMGCDIPKPVSHVAYGYATQVVVLDKNGKIGKVIAAHDVGRAINPTNVEGRIEGGVVMGLGYGLTEDYPLKDSVPIAKFGTLGLFRATDVPQIESIIIEKNKENLAYGAKGVGEITCIPTAPAIQGAYYKFDKYFRTKLPLENTFYRK